jgi:hypothetical protein
MTVTGTTARAPHDTVRSDFMFADRSAATLQVSRRSEGILFYRYLTDPNRWIADGTAGFARLSTQLARSMRWSPRDGIPWRISNENVTPRRRATGVSSRAADALRVTHEGDNSSLHLFGRLRRCALERWRKRCYRLSVTGDKREGKPRARADFTESRVGLAEMGSHLELHSIRIGRIGLDELGSCVELYFTRIGIAVTRNGNTTAGKP